MSAVLNVSVSVAGHRTHPVLLRRGDKQQLVDSEVDDADRAAGSVHERNVRKLEGGGGHRAQGMVRASATHCVLVSLDRKKR